MGNVSQILDQLPISSSFNGIVLSRFVTLHIKCLISFLNDIPMLWLIKHVIYSCNFIWIILQAVDLNILVIPRITSQFRWVEITCFVDCLMECIWVESYGQINVSDPWYYLHAMDYVQRNIRFRNREVVVNKGRLNSNQPSTSSLKIEKGKEIQKDPIVNKEVENQIEKQKEQNRWHQ